MNRVDNRRKHYTQMTADEQAVVLRAIRNRAYDFCHHAIDRMTERGVTEAQILEMIQNSGRLIEAHNNVPRELRCLVRGTVGRHDVCAVVNLSRNQVVTTWCNDRNDNHATLDKSKYLWNVNLVKYFA